MSEPIKVGDLVQVVRGCCTGFRQEADGVIYVAAEIAPGVIALCRHCKGAGRHTLVRQGRIGEWSIPIQYLKRIPPLGELDDVKRDEEITA